MADNYLEKRYAEVFGSSGPSQTPIQRKSIDKLLRLSRGFVRYDRTYVVHHLQTEAITAAVQYPGSLQMHTVLKGPESGIVCKQLLFPVRGAEPEAFILVCTEREESPRLFTELGMALQSMLLKAADLGLGGVAFLDFDKEKLQTELCLQQKVLAVLALGKPLGGTDSESLIV